MTTTKAPPADLELLVQTQREGSQTRLSYTLHSPRGVVPFVHWQVAGPAFAGSPEDLHRGLIHQIEKLAEGREADGTLVLAQDLERHLAGLGRELWDRLFNEEMRLAYRRFRNAARTLLIISDEPWIPWEMIKPYDDDGENPLDDKFLAEQFELTRWLAGKRIAAGELAVRQLAFVPGDLPLAPDERKLVVGLADSHTGLQDVSPASPSVEALVDLLGKGGVGLVHFAAHGTFDPAAPDQAGIALADGSVFRPSHLHGPTQTQVSKDRPLVFLNVCSSGRQAWSWTGLGGWADRWVRACGCGAFLGPQWKVQDDAAFAFAQGLYDALAAGEGLGRAVQEARREARNAVPGDPSWLAYTAYGHPHARVRFGAGRPESEPTVLPGLGSISREDSYKPLRRKTFEQFVADSMKARQERVVEDSTSTPLSQPPSMQRLAPVASTNLRIRKHFSDQDRDKFIQDAFEFMASFFEGSLGQLEQQNSAVGTRFRRLDSDHFVAAIYIQGEKKSSCRIWLDRGHLGDIAYFANDSGTDNSYNETLSAENDGYTMWLRPSGLQIFSANRDRMSAQEASEYFWAMLVGRLQ